jgi:3-hydroxyacyl-[acyl-carrier-protein] dehydratase
MSNSEEKLGKTIDISRVMQMIPHRYPFLMVDKVINVIANESATGVKNVTASEPHFQGHFPQKPIMPGVLIIEAMAQTAAVLVVETLGPQAEGKLVYFMSVHVSKERSRGNVWRFHGEAKVDGQLMAEATYAAMIMDR